MPSKLMHRFGAEQPLDENEIDVQREKIFADGLKVVGKSLQHWRSWVHEKCTTLGHEPASLDCMCWATVATVLCTIFGHPDKTDIAYLLV